MYIQSNKYNVTINNYSISSLQAMDSAVIIQVRIKLRFKVLKKISLSLSTQKAPSLNRI